MSDVTLDPAISASMEALGISRDSLDADETPTVDAENKEVEAEAEASSEGEATEVEAEATEASDKSESATEGEETKEAPVEAPALTAKEFQELEVARQTLETERKAFQEERQNLERELNEKFHEKVKLHDELDAFLVDLETKDPDLLGLIKAQFGEYSRQYNNPVVAGLRNEMAKISQELNQFKSNATAEVTLSQVKADTEKLMGTLGKDAEAAGLKIDIDKVKQTWAKNPSLSLEQAAWVEYGPALMKASASKAKVEKAEKAVAARPAVKTAGSVNRNAGSAGSTVPKNAIDAVYHYAKQLTGKSY